MDKEALRRFYFSTSSSFGTYKAAEDKRGSRREASPKMEKEAVEPGNVSAANVSMPSTIKDDDQSVLAQAPAAATSVPPAGSALKTIRTSQMKHKEKSVDPSTTPASPAYFNFLKQQQELQKQHNRIEESIAQLEATRRERQSELAKLRRQSAELIREIEGCTDWQLKSKYDLQQLLRDCNMTLQPIELTEDIPPQSAGVAQIGSHLAQLKDSFGDSQQFNQHALFVDQGMRRLGLLEGTLKEGNLDVTHLARNADTLLIQLEAVCQLPTAESILSKLEAGIEQAMFKIEEAQKKRAEAIDEGEVHIAEKLCYDILHHHEGMIVNIIQKAKVLENALQDTGIIERVRAEYIVKAVEEFERSKIKSQKLKTRCEEDLKRMFALREKVEEVEVKTAAKTLDEIARSDKVLEENIRKTEIIFVKMDELEKEMEVLERERHKEIQKRVTEKDRDEHRKAEYAQFCNLVETHTVPLERTVRNMDLLMHTATMLSEFVTGGFASIKDSLRDREQLLKRVKLECHKQHVEAMRGLTVELGEIVFKKERMIEETDSNIQQAHIQQELLAETFNPNAKRFGDIKKRLLLNRDELETDVKELKQRAAKSIEEFKYSEDALYTAGIDFIHPVTEQENRALAMRAKMVELKAIAAGHVTDSALLREISEFKGEVTAARTEIESINASTSGTMSNVLPMIRAQTHAKERSRLS